MEQALTSREAVTDLFFRTEADYFQLNRAEYFVPVTFKLPGMQLAGSPSAKRISLDIFGQVTDAYGTTVQNLRDAIDMQLTDETAKQLPARQIAYSAGFTLLPGKYSFKFVIRDGITDRVGTYQTDVVIPNLWKELGSLPISSVVLSNELANFDNILSNSAPSAVDQLIIGGKKLIPSVTRTFSNSRDLIVYLQAYEPDSKPTEPLTAFVTLSRGQTKILETTPVTISDEVNRKALRILPIQLRVPLRTLPEGPYDFQVTVLDTVTQKSTVWQSTINVVN
jgi:hypothetical protein